MLGIRLLTLDATVLVAPAEIQAQELPRPPRRRREAFVDVEPPPEPPRERSSERPSERPVGAGGELADFARLLREGEHTLAAVRVDGPPRA